MDKNTVFAKLASRTPLFDIMPMVARKRIMGTESEYGVQNTLLGDNPIIAYDRLPAMLQNGGEVYEDRGHVEYASPETANIVAAVAYYEAGKVICHRERYSPELYCNNNDWYDNTFGAHENYFTCAQRAVWPRLIPFLIARTVLCGAGWVNEKSRFEISQRAHTICQAQHPDTTTNRPVLNLRPESLARVKGFDRLHLICGDATMSEVSTFLRLGTTSCILEMLELNALPEITYNETYAPADIKMISNREWHLRGVTSGPRSVLALLALYLERAIELFSHRDEVTDALLIIWEDTLHKLESDHQKLWRRLDWATKLFLLNTFDAVVNDSTGDWARAQDMAYHSLNPKEGLYYYLAQQGEMERIVSDELIVHAMYEPPSDTRAYARGKTVQLLEERGGERVLCANSWDHLSIIDVAASGYNRVIRTPNPRRYLSIPMPDPRETYTHLVEKVRKELS
ncbi:MAG: proteasome accessory factor A [Parcubacteria group bacterium Gr01-1014_17]|nr:MAG: proteasome accessory factor A [Parcubacteria group bacterium Gr01-1014_17]